MSDQQQQDTSKTDTPHSFHGARHIYLLTLLFLPAVNLDTLAPEQLSQVKKQLDEELEHLTTSFSQLHGAQTKFKDCLRCVRARKDAPKGR